MKYVTINFLVRNLIKKLKPDIIVVHNRHILNFVINKKFYN